MEPNTHPLAKLYTYRLICGGFATYGGVSEPKAFQRAYSYHGASVVGVEPLSHVCRCENKWARSTRELGWMICTRSECSGRIGG